MSAAPRTQRLLIAAGALALVFGGAWLALQQAFPPSRIAEILAAQASSRAGRDLRIQGKLDWRLLPRLAIVAEDLALANAPWGSRPDMARIRRAALQIELWPLLRGQVHIHSVTLDGVDLLLETNAQGVGNWHMPRLIDGGGSGPGGRGTVAPIGISALHLSDVQLAYRDGLSGHKRAFALQRLSLDRDDQGLKLDAQAVLQQQRWQASGQLGPIEQLLADQTDWPVKVALRSEGARLDAVGQILKGPAPRAARLAIDARIDKAAALAPWLDNAGQLPLPIALQTTLQLGSAALQADPLTLSLAGQALKGSASVSHAKPWQAQARLSGQTLDLAHLWPAVASGGAAATATRRQLFDDTPLPIDTLPQGDVTLELRIERLLVPDAPPLSDFRADVRLRPGSLKIEPLGFGAAGGQVRAAITLNTAVGVVPRLHLRVDASGLSLHTLVRSTGARNDFSGGQLQLKSDLAMTGRSASALAASADGELLLSVKDTTLGGGVAPIGFKLLAQVLRAIALQPQAAKSTQVQCAVMRLPLRNGVAQVDRSIAVETPDLAISAAGRIDLRDQSMELVFRPISKHAAGLNTTPLASLVVAKGPLLDPKLTLDAKGAAAMALSIGAAVATGGWSVLGQNLLKPAGDLRACQFALTGVAAAPKSGPDATAAPARAPPSPQQALPGLLRRLFKN
jgi:uncharacterized protein involved in outer membrane biogenesis